MDESQLLEVLETALLCADQPMKVGLLAKLFGDEDEISNDAIKQQLLKIQDEWANKGLELVELAGGWRFQSRPRMQKYLERLNPEKPPKYSRAVMETLAIIAWRQPVTRGDIEDIRGVSVSSQIIKTLEERDWIEVIGHRDGPGRPALFGITKHFLDDMGLKSVEELPTIETDPEMFMSGDSELAQLLQEQSAQLALGEVGGVAEHLKQEQAIAVAEEAELNMVQEANQEANTEQDESVQELSDSPVEFSDDEPLVQHSDGAVEQVDEEQSRDESA